MSLGPRFSGETGKIAMPMSASRLHAVDDMTFGRLGASISRGEEVLMVRISSRGLRVGLPVSVSPIDRDGVDRLNPKP